MSPGQNATWTKCHPDKMSPRQNVTGQNIKRTKYQTGKISNGQNIKWTKYQTDTGKLSKDEIRDILIYELQVASCELGI